MTIREIAPVAPWFPQNVYVRQDENGVPQAFDAATDQPVKTADGDNWNFLVASNGKETRAMFRYDNVEVR